MHAGQIRNSLHQEARVWFLKNTKYPSFIHFSFALKSRNNLCSILSETASAVGSSSVFLFFFLNPTDQSHHCIQRGWFLCFWDATILALQFTSVPVAKQLLTLWGCGVNAGAAVVFPRRFAPCTLGLRPHRLQHAQPIEIHNPYLGVFSTEQTRWNNWSCSNMDCGDGAVNENTCRPPFGSNRQLQWWKKPKYSQVGSW